MARHRASLVSTPAFAVPEPPGPTCVRRRQQVPPPADGQHSGRAWEAELGLKRRKKAKTLPTTGEEGAEAYDSGLGANYSGRRSL